MSCLDTDSKLALLGREACYEVSAPGRWRDPCDPAEGVWRHTDRVTALPASLARGHNARGHTAREHTARGHTAASNRRGGRPAEGWIYPAALPGGGRAPVLKILLDNRCALGCGYCAQGRHCDGPRASFEPGELSRLFDDLHRAGRVRGLFLSSAIRGHPDTCMERIVTAAEQLRSRYGFQGYVHLKVLPGASSELAVRAARVADRLSLNLEAATAGGLARIAPEKAAPGRERPGQVLRRLSGLVGRPDLRCHSQTTQLVVGAGPETDREILRTTEISYRRLGLARVYYAAFSPVPGTPLAHRAPCNPMRAARLYQADTLLRCYGFTDEELIFDRQGELDPDRDPKAAWAAAHPERFPLEANRARRSELLRVPGIGPVTADRILRRRRQGTLRELVDLGLRGAAAARVAPYLLLNGRACMGAKSAGPRAAQTSWSLDCQEHGHSVL